MSSFALFETVLCVCVGIGCVIMLALTLLVVATIAGSR